MLDAKCLTTTTEIGNCPMIRCKAPTCKDWEYGKLTLDDGF
jgi:hypothetical protein